MQVTAYGARGQEQSLGDLFVGQAGGGQRRDLPLLGGERDPREGINPGFGLTGGA